MSNVTRLPVRYRKRPLRDDPDRVDELLMNVLVGVHVVGAVIMIGMFFAMLAYFGYLVATL